MQAYVYKSQRKQDSFVYLAVRDDFSVIPFQFVLEVALTPDRRLAQVDAAQVRQNLTERGFHLQLPPPPLAPVRFPRRND